MVFTPINRTVTWVLFKLHPEDLMETVQFIKNTFADMSPYTHLARYMFEDEQFEQAYRQELRMRTVVTTFSGLAIFLACLGLFGLVSYAAEVRTKEIGIRKVLGASVSGIVMMLSKDFVKLVLVANVIAWPVAYYAAHEWLGEFAYRIDVSVWPFALGALLAFGIALGTVGYQALKAARANPVEALRYE